MALFGLVGNKAKKKKLSSLPPLPPRPGQGSNTHDSHTATNNSGLPPLPPLPPKDRQAQQNNTGAGQSLGDHNSKHELPPLPGQKNNSMASDHNDSLSLPPLHEIAAKKANGGHNADDLFAHHVFSKGQQTMQKKQHEEEHDAPSSLPPLPPLPSEPKIEAAPSMPTVNTTSLSAPKQQSHHDDVPRFRANDMQERMGKSSAGKSQSQRRALPAFPDLPSSPQVPSSQSKVSSLSARDLKEDFSSFEKRTVSRQRRELNSMHERHVAGPIFIKIDNFRHILGDITDMKNDLGEMEGTVDKMLKIKIEEDKKFAQWQEQLEEIQRKFLFMDKTLFDNPHNRG